MICRNIISTFILYPLVAFYLLFVSCNPKENIDPNDISVSFDDLLIEEFPMNFHPKKIDFWNESIGYAITWDSLIIKTENGGLDWQVITRTNHILESIQVVNTDLAVAYGWQKNSGGTIFQIDGTESIQMKELELEGTGSQVRFINENIGFGFGKGVFFKTYNSGITWVEEDFELTTFTFIAFTNDGKLITNASNGFHVSYDTAESWKVININGDRLFPSEYWEANGFYYFLDNPEFYTLDKNYESFKRYQSIGETNSMHLFDQSTLISFGFQYGKVGFFPTATISITNNGGEDWETKFIDKYEKVVQTDFINQKVGYAIADDLTGQGSSLLKIEILK